MTPAEKRAIAQFMNSVADLVIQDKDKFPFDEMAKVQWTEGEKFEGTAFENFPQLQKKFYLLEALQNFTIGI